MPSVGIAAHLGINLAEYDARIRTFIPHYEEMLDEAASAVPRDAQTIVDLGTGTGALAARCAKAARHARIVGIDADAEILKVAARRLGARATFIAESFLRANLPRADVFVSSFALHHVRTRVAKARLYQRIHRALHPQGRVITVDCQPAANAALKESQMAEWRAHLLRSYSKKNAAKLLSAWAREDVYVPLETEMTLMRQSGFRVEGLWRDGAFAVLSGQKRD